MPGDGNDRHRVTPSGLVIDYFDKSHRYKVNGEWVPSVTTILGVLDKSGPLVSWATRIDVAAALDLATGDWLVCRVRGCDAAFVPVRFDMEAGPDDCPACGGTLWPYELPDEGWKLQNDMRRAGIDHNAVVGDAQLRGTAVHKLHEDWVNEQRIPAAKDYPEEWRGYIAAYARFLLDHKDKVAFEEAEVMVASAVHGFAGTCDTVCVGTVKDTGVRTRLDFKTSKGIYPSSHFPQLAGYEIGARESGDPATDRQGIVRLDADGTYEIGWSTAGPEDFIALVNAQRSQKPFKDAERKAYNAKRKAKR